MPYRQITCSRFNWFITHFWQQIPVCRLVHQAFCTATIIYRQVARNRLEPRLSLTPYAVIDKSNHFGAIELKTVPHAKMKVHCVYLQIGIKSFFVSWLCLSTSCYVIMIHGVLYLTSHSGFKYLPKYYVMKLKVYICCKDPG